MSLDQMKVGHEDRKEKWAYFSYDGIAYREKLYRLIWCTHDDLASFGVVNCFRR